MKGGPRDWGLGDGLTTPHRKYQFVTKCYTGTRNWTDGQDKDQWWAFVGTVMNLWVSVKGGEFLEYFSDC